MGLSRAGAVSPSRRARRGQHGFTLTELLVTIAVLAAIGGSVAGAFTIGLRVLGPGLAPAHLTGSGDLLSFEQQIGADVARADCLAAPHQTMVPAGGCSSTVPAHCTSGYVLCLAYFVPVTGAVCHVISYVQQSNDSLERLDYHSGSTSGSRFTTGGLMVTASWSASDTNNNGYLWTNQVSVAVTQSGTPGAATSNTPAATFLAVPLVSDPLSPATGGTTAPC